MAQQFTYPPTHEERFRMSFAEYVAWTRAFERRSEWVDGEVTVFAMPTLYHQRLIAFLVRFLGHLAETHNLGEVFPAGLQMRVRNGRSVREPDVVFVAWDHAHRMTKDRLEGPADLLVEIVSPESISRDRREKLREYEEIGVPEYWIFDSRDGHRGVDAFRLVSNDRYERIPIDPDGAIRSTVVPGFFIRPEWLQGEHLPTLASVLAT